MVIPISWTPPRTFVAGEVLTALNMNTHVRDNLLVTVQPFYRDASWVNIGSIGGGSNTGVVAAVGAPSLVAPITGRLFWNLTGWFRNTAAGTLSTVTVEVILGGSGGTLLQNPAAPIGSQALTGTGYHDVTAGTSYAIAARGTTGSGTGGGWAFDAFVATFRYGTLI